jgi:hypothetical protein
MRHPDFNRVQFVVIPPRISFEAPQWIRGVHFSISLFPPMIVLQLPIEVLAELPPGIISDDDYMDLWIL